ncbi:penicillin-binding protein, beta-lactamase class C [Acidovorax sp. CF316]|uniref:serine hydrolase domain-containing protein n=1 Tax=Acidovorax sp. CF316 TaxID=1144317 RepID=UPI00026BC037|nr:hydrolase [Acidovorax sp. CF316]EJE48521.1 penicillin-binding protein, beta-lactamase class C [Acidovorax sp. CF316]
MLNTLRSTAIAALAATAIMVGGAPALADTEVPPAAVAAPRQASAQGVYPGVAWSTPATSGQPSGWSEDKLQLADSYADSLRSDAYLVVHRGVLVHAYGDIRRPMNLASVRKSVLSVLYGMHVGRGAIDLDQSLASLGITDKGGLSDVEQTATVRQLLQSRSGVYHEAAYETPAAKKRRPERGSHAPGTYWYYNNWDFNALATIFQRRTGKDVFEALKTELAEPLQFEDFRYPQDTKFEYERSSEHPAYLMFLSARDLARIGLLVGRDGQWQGRQMVPSAWLRESTTSYSAASGGSGYGYMWWLPFAAFPSWRLPGNQLVLADGSGGQFMLIDRARDIVLVHRVDNSRLWFKRNAVDLGQFAELAARVIAAAPARQAVGSTAP